MTQLLIPIAAPVSEDNINGLPIEIEEFNGTLSCELAVSNYLNSKKIKKIIVIIHGTISENNGLTKVLKSIFDERLVIKKIYNFTLGAVCTALMALDEIDLKENLIITSLDQVVDINIDKLINFFEKSSSAGGLVTFKSRNPRWSYALIENERVTQTAEKNPISTSAIAGIYFFKTGRIFRDSSFELIFKKANQLNDVFYISAIFNELVINNNIVIPYQISSENYIKFLSREVFINYVLNLSENDKITYSLEKLTHDYCNNFNRNDIKAIENQLHNNAVLLEVSKNTFEGRKNIILMLKNLFKTSTVKFEAVNIEVAQKTHTTIIEFILHIDEDVFMGIDILNWENFKIKRITAYFFKKNL